MAYGALVRYGAKRFGPRAAYLAGRGVRFAWKNRKSLKKIGRRIAQGVKRRMGGTNSVVTAQRDVQTTRPPKRQRTSRTFSKKVDRVISDHAGRQTVVFRGGGFGNTSSSQLQNYDFLPLFGCNGSSGASSDMAKLAKYYDELADDDISLNSKNLMFHYGVLDVYFTNASATTAMYVDIYEWRVKKNVVHPALSMTALELQQEGEEEVLEETVGTVGLVKLDGLGVTPYQIPSMCKYITWGKKTSIQLQALGTSRYTLARKKNKWISGDKIVDTAGVMMPGWTEGLLFIFRGPPAAAGVSASSASINYAFTRKYSWRAMDPHAKNGYVYEVW